MKMRNILLSLTLAAAGLCGAIGSARADTLALYDFATTPKNSPTGPPTTVATGVTASGVTRGAGLLTDTTASLGFLNANGFEGAPGAPGTMQQAINGNDYFTFTVGPTDPAQTLTFSQLDLQVARSGTGPTDFFVRSSLDSFASDLLLISGAANTSTAGTIANPTFTPGSVLFGNQFQSISTPIEFRVYGFGAVNSVNATTGVVTQGGVGRIDNIVLSGTVNSLVAPVPEPSTYAMFVIGVGGVAFTLRRKKSAGDAADATTSASVLSPC